MIDLILRGLLVGGGAAIGSRLGDKYLNGTSETPIWTGHLGGDAGKPAVSLTVVRHGGRVQYRVYVVADGAWAQVAGCAQYPQALAIIQQWEVYIQGGGTVQAWLAQNYARANEVAALEQNWAAQ